MTTITKLHFNGSDYDIGTQNVKVFTLSGTSDLVNAQAAYDWYANGGIPIVKISGSNGHYYLSVATATVLDFSYVKPGVISGGLGEGTILSGKIIRFNVSSDIVTSVSTRTQNLSLVTALPATPSIDSIYFVTN